MRRSCAADSARLYKQEDIFAYYGFADDLASWSGASWNLAPTQDIGVIVKAADGLRLTAMRWGLIPSWAKDEKIGGRMINARAETVAEKPAFRAAFRARRCIIPASGFYEWQAAGRVKQPYYISRRDGHPLSFAGLWERWRDGAGADILSCAIITTVANEAIEPVHDRMPVILGREAVAAWLNQGGADLLQPCPPEWLQLWPVSRLVNNPRSQGPDLIRRADA